MTLFLGALSTLVVTLTANLLVMGPLRQRHLGAAVLEFQAANECRDQELARRLRAEAHLRLRKYMLKLDKTVTTVIEVKALGLMAIVWLPIASALSAFAPTEGGVLWVWVVPLGVGGAVLQIYLARRLTRVRAVRLLEAEKDAAEHLDPSPRAKDTARLGVLQFLILLCLLGFLPRSQKASAGAE